MILIDAWKVFRSEWEKQKELERKKKAFERFTQKTLNYTLIEEIVGSAAAQNPGFYSILKFPDGTTWEFGKKDKPLRRDGETW